VEAAYEALELVGAELLDAELTELVVASLLELLSCAIIESPFPNFARHQKRRPFLNASSLVM
jgi:hypothetical protein